MKKEDKYKSPLMKEYIIINTGENRHRKRSKKHQKRS